MAILTGPRIRHTVAFSLRDDLGSPQVESFLVALRALGDLDGVHDLEVVRQVGAKNSYEFGAVMEFADQAAYDAYNGHPTHVAFVEDRWNVEVADFIEIDFLALGERGSSGT